MGGATVVFGGQAGSEGKGAIVGYLARRERFDAAICNFMTNAGHTWMGDDGEKVVVQQLPVSLVSPEIPLLLIGPGSAITLEQLWKEIGLYDSDYNVSARLRIHPRAVIIDPAHVAEEQSGVKYIASTLKGCGTALAAKSRRDPALRLARDIEALKPFLADTTTLVNNVLAKGGPVMVEGAQGYDLDINHGISYPHCTSRQTTPAQVLADSGIAPQRVRRSIAVVRSYPIRVGNIVEGGEQVGYSGPFGAREVTFEEIEKRSGYPTPLAEFTTVTKRLRRIFEMDFERVAQMVQVTGATHLALTFADYLDYKIAGMGGSAYDDVNPADYPDVLDFVRKLNVRNNPTLVDWIKTGPKDSEVIAWN